MARRHDAPGDEPAGVHAAAGGAGSATEAASSPVLKSIRGELADASQRDSGATVNCRRRASRKRALVGDSLRCSWKSFHKQRKESAASVRYRVAQLHRRANSSAMRRAGIGNPTTRAQISSLQPPSKPAFCVRSHDHWASPGPDAALTRPFGATGSATSTARPTARSRRRPVCPLTNRCVDRARHRVLPGLTRPSPGRLAPPARHHLHPVRHTRPKAAARAPGRWAAPGRPHRCAPGSA